MTQEASTGRKSLKHSEWIWQSNANPWSASESPEWSHYSDVENLIIEEAFLTKKSDAIIDDYRVNFADMIQIKNNDGNKQRPVKRILRKREDKHLRESRFIDVPFPNGRTYGDQYGWVSPFILEVRKYFNLTQGKSPSTDNDLLVKIVDEAAFGIIEEGKQIGKQCEAEKMARLLKEKRDKGMKEIWKCCAYLYSLESFLYKTLNSVMRLIGNQGNEQIWRSKVRTLGPFCLLLWNDPLNTKLKTNTKLYRGADLTSEQIIAYENMAKSSDEYHSFQAFTSCSRSREKAEEFGNTLFIMKVFFAFTADLSHFSEYPHEEEELITPGVCFKVESVDFDQKTHKHIVRLQLRQRFCDDERDHIIMDNIPKTRKNQDELTRALDEYFGDHSSDRAFDYYINRRSFRLFYRLGLGGRYNRDGSYT